MADERAMAIAAAAEAWVRNLTSMNGKRLTDRERDLLFMAFQAGSVNALHGSERVDDGTCWITDCPSPVATWMVSEMAPGRPLVYGACGVDAARIHMHEQEVGGRS